MNRNTDPASWMRRRDTVEILHFAATGIPKPLLADADAVDLDIGWDEPFPHTDVQRDAHLGLTALSDGILGGDSTLEVGPMAFIPGHAVPLVVDTTIVSSVGVARVLVADDLAGTGRRLMTTAVVACILGARRPTWVRGTFGGSTLRLTPDEVARNLVDRLQLRVRLSSPYRQAVETAKPDDESLAFGKRLTALFRDFVAERIDRKHV